MRRSTLDVVVGVIVLSLIMLLWSMNSDIKEIKSEMRWLSSYNEMIAKELGKSGNSDHMKK